MDLMMEAARTCEKLVNIYQITRRYNPEDSHLRTHRRENLRSYLMPFFLVSCPGTVPKQDFLCGFYVVFLSFSDSYFTMDSLSLPLNESKNCNWF
jgi:hypothetical protein